MHKKLSERVEFFRGQKVKDPVLLAQAEAAAQELAQNGKLRFAWEPDPDPDTSHRSSTELEDYEYHGCRLQMRCGECGAWKTKASLWGIEFLRWKPGRDPLCDIVEAELAAEVLL